nr:unnamed protein product [Callosobruchus chinensis]
METSPASFPEGFPQQKRKMSFPTTTLALPTENTAFRRRLSNVGDAARKLSTTIGWKTVAVNGPPPEEVTIIGRSLCSLYVRTKLKRAGMFNKKLGLTRVRSTIGTMDGCGIVIKDVFPGLMCACSELERIYPNLYCNIPRLVGRKASESIGGILPAVGDILFSQEPSWGKVVSVYCVAGGLAVDVVRLGRPDWLPIIMDDMKEFLEDRMSHWIHANGGWLGLLSHCRQIEQDISFKEYLAIFGLVAVIFLVSFFVVKLFAKLGLF